jgi:hypothetical protein
MAVSGGEHTGGRLAMACHPSSRRRKGSVMRNRLILVAIILVLGSLACALPTPGGSATATATPTVSPFTATPSPTPVSAALITKCFGSSSTSVGKVVGSGDMLYSQPLMGFLAYPNVMLPDGTPLAKPYKISSAGPAAYATDFLTSPITNPSLSDTGGGFYFGICNTSATKSHTLQAITAKIVAFVAYGGQLNQWNGCDGATDSHHQLAGGGCGGAMAGCVCFHAPFATSAGAGAEVTTTQTNDSLNAPGDHAGKLPLALGPGHVVFVFVGMSKPSAAGQYTLTMGLQVDGKTSYSPASPSLLLAPVAHKWTGQACQSPAMLAQITATTPETYYLCPQS